MAASFSFLEDNGTATGSPSRGTFAGNTASDLNFKNIDDSTTAYTSYPITAGNNSYEKWIYGEFSGTFTQIQNLLWAHTAGSYGTGLTVMGTVTSTYTTPSTSTNASLTTNMTSAISIGSGQSVNLSGTGPYAASPTSSCTTNPCYSQYMPVQLQTSGTATPGVLSSTTYTLSYQEF